MNLQWNSSPRPSSPPSRAALAAQNGANQRRRRHVPLSDLFEVVLRVQQAASRTCEINYQSIGSGGGIRQVTNRTVFFGATDGR